MTKKKVSLILIMLIIIFIGFTFSPFNYKKLNVPNYKQMELGIPEGCEGVSLLQGLHYKKEALNETPVSFLNKIPRSTSPYNGFGGNPFMYQKGIYSAIYAKPLTIWGQNFGNVFDISNSSPKELYKEVRQGNPVVVWVTIDFQPIKDRQWSFGTAPMNNHAVLLAGYNHIFQKVYVSDPIGGKRWISKNTFEQIYNERKMAVVVK